MEVVVGERLGGTLKMEEGRKEYRNGRNVGTDLEDGGR